MRGEIRFSIGWQLYHTRFLDDQRVQGGSLPGMTGFYPFEDSVVIGGAGGCLLGLRYNHIVTGSSENRIF
jgi:hypothetical protein